MREDVAVRLAALSPPQLQTWADGLLVPPVGWGETQETEIVLQPYEQQLRILPTDPKALRAAKVALKAGRRLHHDDNPALVEVVTGAVRDATEPSHTTDAADPIPRTDG